MKYEEKYYLYLDGLRESGVTNMFGAASYLQNEFPELDKSSATKVLVDWMNTFGKREEAKPGSGLARSRGQVE